MSQSFSQKPKPSEVDIVFDILQTQGRPQHYFNLVEEVLRRLDLPQEPQRIAAVLTQINLDSRFSYVGQGEWGLKAWVPQRGARRVPSIAVANKADYHDDAEENLGINAKLNKIKDVAQDDLEDNELNLDDELLDLEDEFEEDFEDEELVDPEESREDNWE